MRKVLGLSLSVLALAVMTGCSNIRATNNFNGQGMTVESSTPMAHINAKISGFFMLGFIPIWSGSETDPGDWNLFTNNVTVTKTVWLAVNKSKDVGGNKLVDLKSVYEEKPIWVIIPTFWMSIKECQVSGNSIKK